MLTKFHFSIPQQEKKNYFPWKNFHCSDRHLVFCKWIYLNLLTLRLFFFEDKSYPSKIFISSVMSFLCFWISADPEYVVGSVTKSFIYIWCNTSKCWKCPGEVFWWIVTPKKIFRVTVIHLVEIRLARDLCYSSTSSRLWKSRRCWFVSGNKPLKESSLKIQVGFMSLDSSFDCYSDFMYIFGMSNKPGIWIEITLIKCKYLLFVHCTCRLINWTSLTWTVFNI